MRRRWFIAACWTALLVPSVVQAFPLCWILSPFLQDRIQVEVTEVPMGFAVDARWRGGQSYQLTGTGLAALAFPNEPENPEDPPLPPAVILPLTLINPTEFFGGNINCTLVSRLSLVADATFLTGPVVVACVGVTVDEVGNAVVRDPFRVEAEMLPDDNCDGEVDDLLALSHLATTTRLAGE